MTAIAENGGALLRELRGMANGPVRHNMLVLISLANLPGEPKPGLWDGFERMTRDLAERMRAQRYRLGREEVALLLKVSERDGIGFGSQMRLDLLRLVEEYLPNMMDRLCQDRMVRMVDLTKKLKNAILILSRYENEVAEEKPAAADGRRPLREEDILKVETVAATYGPQSFFQAYVRSQPVVLLQPKQKPRVITREYYVAMDKLTDQILKGVDLRGSGNLFTQLTVTLDNILLDAFPTVMPPAGHCSLNLNVPSVFTKRFERFCEAMKAGERLKRISLELRQEDILRHYDEYLVAVDYIRGLGATLVVDGVTLQTVGVVNLPRLSAHMAKLFWRGDGDQLGMRREDIKAMQDQGTLAVLARVDETEALQLGHQAGISLFQGYTVDKLMETANAAA